MIERVKSWTLTILIATSAVLTYQLWTFQPNLDYLDESGYVPSETSGEELALNDVIWPEQLIFHDGLHQVSLDGHENLFARFYNDFLDARVENITLHQNVEADDMYEGQRIAEVIYPTAIPGDVVNSVLNIEDDIPYLSIDMVDRILLVDNGGESENLVVRLVSYGEQIILEGETNFSMSDFRDIYLEGIDQYPSVFSYEIQNNSSLTEFIYLPEESVTYTTLSDTFSEMNYNVFLRLLFNDTDYVKQYHQDNREASFTDGNRMMTLEDNGHYLQYINPVYSENVQESQQHVVETGFDFINSRGGWTDTYHLYDWGYSNQEENVSYRMIVAGLPVFESRGRDLASINVTRAGGQVSQFSRPLFNLDGSPINARGSMELARGEQVIAFAEQQFDPESIENIRVGYKMEKTDNVVVRLEPSWYVKYDDAWYPIDPEEAEEEGENGLE
ncbi:Two-component signal transduction system YycFG, regulatory protein YycH [Alteribacillus persepolensis]|uniref:Two-component signal transduction system YycFG, regulatory protein YycH n=1 Tax=Alteribacillus persepolensis TaxID=568899 RepID=A0A1G8G7T6_9BACI|nr:two-component system activity regulator YycH [Alteribacillus persepolensis]SDH90459.1 Two-component signal transduction system YycFG, regulatory protein YycH [Alteribacillus persepolensis]